MSTFVELQELLIEGVELSEAVMDRWEEGDLAHAVRHLNDWTKKVRKDVLPAPRLTL